VKLLLASLLVAVAFPRIVQFPGGQAIVTTTQGVDHVVVKDVKGNVESDSFCDEQTGRYDAVVAFGKALTAAASRRDEKAVAALLQYPFRANATSQDANAPVKTLTLKNRSELLARYSAVFTPAIVDRLARVQPYDVFCRNGMSTIGGGLIWATVNDGTLKGAVLNR
jgi:hypothetical protein